MGQMASLQEGTSNADQDAAGPQAQARCRSFAYGRGLVVVAQAEVCLSCPRCGFQSYRAHSFIGKRNSWVFYRETARLQLRIFILASLTLGSTRVLRVSNV